MAKECTKADILKAIKYHSERMKKGIRKYEKLENDNLKKGKNKQKIPNI